MKCPECHKEMILKDESMYTCETHGDIFYESAVYYWKGWKEREVSRALAVSNRKNRQVTYIDYTGEIR